MPNRRFDLPPLDRLEAFEAAARNLSFTRAAAELSLTQSAVSRAIASLEERLGFPLFERRHRALLLTERGPGAVRGDQRAAREAATRPWQSCAHPRRNAPSPSPPPSRSLRFGSCRAWLASRAHIPESTSGSPRTTRSWSWSVRGSTSRSAMHLRSWRRAAASCSGRTSSRCAARHWQAIGRARSHGRRICTTTSCCTLPRPRPRRGWSGPSGWRRLASPTCDRRERCTSATTTSSSRPRSRGRAWRWVACRCCANRSARECWSRRSSVRSCHRAATSCCARRARSATPMSTHSNAGCRRRRRVAGRVRAATSALGGRKPSPSDQTPGKSR